MKFFSGITCVIVLFFLSDHQTARYLLVDIMDDDGAREAGVDRARSIGATDSKFAGVSWHISRILYIFTLCGILEPLTDI